ncbi:hypothetical protein HZS_9 [Henneguya salminicola]|nr:hypothetical protein HZS_9 [Henneguya salminicola]
MAENDSILFDSCNFTLLKSNSDIAGSAVFAASSAREGFGLENVRDDNRNSYWQSNGALPHHIDIIFPRFTKISTIFMYISPSDESYAPCQVIIQAGTDFNDLQTVFVQETSLFYYWQELILKSKNSYIEAIVLRVVILNNHYNGIDSRLRQLLICGPEDKMPKDVVFQDISHLSTMPEKYGYLNYGRKPNLVDQDCSYCLQTFN